MVLLAITYDGIRRGSPAAFLRADPYIYLIDLNGHAIACWGGDEEDYN